MFKKTFVISLAVTFLALQVKAAEPKPSEQDDLTAPVDTLEEAAPAPEPPYPGSEDNAFAADPSMLKNDIVEDVPTTPQEPLTPRPKRVDEEGNYYFDTEVKAPQFSGHPDLKAPAGTAKSGEFLYDTTSTPPEFSGREGVEKPAQILANGEFRYKVEASKATKSASFRFGVMTPPSIKNKDNGLSYADIYGSTPQFVLFVDYEFYRVFSKGGRLGLKFGSGALIASAPGHFKDPARAAEVPDEHYTFLLFPNTFSANYRFQYAEKQILVPFVEGGGGYYAVSEIRDDGQKPKIGGAPVITGAGGLNFLMDWLDPQAIRQLDADYGINHLWLTTEVRATVGLSSELNFSNTSVNAGFMMEF